MTRFASIAAIALMAAACAPSETGTADTETTARPDAAAGATSGMPMTQAQLAEPGAGALHELLLAEEDRIVPSDWHTGEPAGQEYWDIPETLDGLHSASECDWTSDDQSTMDCTLTLSEPEDAPDGPRHVMYRAEIGYTPEGALILLSPNVRWAVMG